MNGNAAADYTPAAVHGGAPKPAAAAAAAAAASAGDSSSLRGGPSGRIAAGTAMAEASAQTPRRSGRVAAMQQQGVGQGQEQADEEAAASRQRGRAGRGLPSGHSQQPSRDSSPTAAHSSASARSPDARAQHSQVGQLGIAPFQPPATPRPETVDASSCALHVTCLQLLGDEAAVPVVVGVTEEGQPKCLLACMMEVAEAQVSCCGGRRPETRQATLQVAGWWASVVR